MENSSAKHMVRVPYGELEETIYNLYRRLGAGEENARLAAEHHAQSSRDGVPSHGVNRVPSMAKHIRLGNIDPAATPQVLAREGARVQMDGRRGIGSANAVRAMDEACALAEEHGIGVVGLQNTSTWLRAGAYGWQAAGKGYVAICWSNTLPNMVAWGGKEPVLGNNPFVLAVPRANGRHVVLDMAMSQFSYGAMQNAALEGRQLPFDGGWNSEGELTKDPAAIMDSMRVLPTGYWKGSGLSLALDLMGALLAGGRTVSEIGKNGTQNNDVTQVMIAAKPALLGLAGEEKIDFVLQDLHGSGENVRYPGEKEYATRQESMEKGVLVHTEMWEKVQAL